MKTEAPARFIVGLGNPGESYARSRHNIGFMVVDALARSVSGTWATQHIVRTCKVDLGGYPAILAQPLTYMNHSGKAVHTLLSAFGCGAESLIVILDDLNLPFGRLRIRERGAAGGHHGLESIFSFFNTDEIIRLRLGIGEERMPRDKADFVLSEFLPHKCEDLEAMIIKAGDAVRSILTDGVAKTMAIYNA